MAAAAAHVYYHSPCFDGLISAVLIADYLATSGRHSLTFHPVNYDLNASWAALTLDQPAAIVDFMYHPDATIWFDHHSTAFQTQAFEQHYHSRRDPLIVHDRQADSCAMLIWSRRLPMSGDHADKVRAADLIDSARYVSPQQAVFGDAPEFRINASMAMGETDDYTRHLIRHLLTHTLETTAELPIVVERYARFRSLQEAGLQRFSQTPDVLSRNGYVLTDDGILMFAVDGSGVMISRYAPFLVAPTARYSVGVVFDSDRAKITAMRNPWLEFPSVPLGEIFRSIGGGGHQRVASARLHGKSRSEVIQMLMGVKQAIQSAAGRSMAPA
jgi:hypothetical protein